MKSNAYKILLGSRRTGIALREAPGERQIRFCSPGIISVNYVDLQFLLNSELEFTECSGAGRGPGTD